MVLNLPLSVEGRARSPTEAARVSAAVRQVNGIVLFKERPSGVSAMRFERLAEKISLEPRWFIDPPKATAMEARSFLAS